MCPVLTPSVTFAWCHQSTSTCAQHAQEFHLQRAQAELWPAYCPTVGQPPPALPHWRLSFIFLIRFILSSPATRDPITVMVQAVVQAEDPAVTAVREDPTHMENKFMLLPTEKCLINYITEDRHRLFPFPSCYYYGSSLHSTCLTWFDDWPPTGRPLWCLHVFFCLMRHMRWSDMTWPVLTSASPCTQF